MCGIAISTSLFQAIGIIYKCCWPLPSHPGYIASSGSSRIVVEVFVFINTRNSKIGRVFTNSSLKYVSLLMHPNGTCQRDLLNLAKILTKTILKRYRDGVNTRVQASSLLIAYHTLVRIDTTGT